MQEAKKTYFTYDEGHSARGDGYTLQIPDGFVINYLSEGRDFVAYIPNPDEPMNYEKSEFIIMAGKKLTNDAIAKFKTKFEYYAINASMGNMMAMQGQVHVVNYERDDLPGGLVYFTDGGCLHVNGVFGVDNHIRRMRVQISDRYASDEILCRDTVVELFDHMYADKPVELLKPLNAPEFVQMKPESKDYYIWLETMQNHISHLATARKMTEKAIVDACAKGMLTPDEMKARIIKLLEDISGITEKALNEAFEIYMLKFVQYPAHIGDDEMLGLMNLLADFATQAVTIDDEYTEVKSAASKVVKERLAKPIDQILDVVLAEMTVNGSAVADALKLAKDGYPERKKAAEEKRAVYEKQILEQEAREKERLESARILQEKKARYEDAKKLMDKGNEKSIQEAVWLFNNLAYEDSDTLHEEATRKLDELRTDKQLAIEYDATFPNLKQKNAILADVQKLEKEIEAEKKHLQCLAEEVSKGVIPWTTLIIGVLSLIVGILLMGVPSLLAGILCIVFYFGYLKMNKKLRAGIDTKISAMEDELAEKQNILNEIKNIPTFEVWKVSKK